MLAFWDYSTLKIEKQGGSQKVNKALESIIIYDEKQLLFLIFMCYI